MYRPDLKGYRSDDLTNFSSSRDDRFVSIDRHLMSDSALIRGLQSQSDRQRVIDNLSEVLGQRENELRRLRETISRLELTVAQRDQQVAHLFKSHNTFHQLHSLPPPPPTTSEQEGSIVSSDLSGSNIVCNKLMVEEDKPVLLRSHSAVSLSDDEDISNLTPGTSTGSSGKPDKLSAHKGLERSAVSNPDHQLPTQKVKQPLGPTRSLPPPVSPRSSRPLPPPPVGTALSIPPPSTSPSPFVIPGSSKSAYENLVIKNQELKQKVKLLEKKHGKDSNELLSVDNYKRMTGELKDALEKKEKELAAATSSKAKGHDCADCSAMQNECKVLKRRFAIQQNLMPLMSGKLEEKELEVESLLVKLTALRKEKAALEKKLERVDRGSPGPGDVVRDKPHSPALRPGAGPLSQVFTQLMEEHKKCAPERDSLVSQLAERDGVIHHQEERLTELQRQLKTASDDVAFERKKFLQTARLEKEARKKASAEKSEIENLQKELGTVSSEKLALTLQLEEYRATNDNLQRQMQAAKRQMLMQRASSEPPPDTPSVPLVPRRQSPQPPSMQPASSPQFTRAGSPKVPVKVFVCPRCQAQIKCQEAFTSHFKSCSRR